jgi:tRNA modification GTPase
VARWEGELCANFLTLWNPTCCAFTPLPSTYTYMQATVHANSQNHVSRTHAAGTVVGGVPITLLDTAGLRSSTDVVEALGVERSLAAAQQADVVVMVMDAAAGWTGADGEVFASIFGSKGGEGRGEGVSLARSSAPSLLVMNKIDATGPHSPGSMGPAAASSSNEGGSDGMAQAGGLPAYVAASFSAVVGTSAVTREGLDSLRDALLRLAGAPELASGGSVSWSVNERQAEALVRAREALDNVKSSVDQGLPIDFWTVDLRAALMALGEVSGDEVSEEILDSIFSRFCIGK